MKNTKPTTADITTADITTTVMNPANFWQMREQGAEATRALFKQMLDDPKLINCHPQLKQALACKKQDKFWLHDDAIIAACAAIFAELYL